MARRPVTEINLDNIQSEKLRHVGCFQKFEMIGQGGFGQVHRAKDIETGEIVALKQIVGSTHETLEEFKHEVKVTRMLNHENIIQLKEIVFAQGRGVNEQGNPVGRRFYMVFEYMNHDLWGLVQKGEIKLPHIKLYMKQLLTGLRYLHDNKVLHRDIKGHDSIELHQNLGRSLDGLGIRATQARRDNILVDDEGNLKIADFGLARELPNDPNEPLTPDVIIHWYSPPELLLRSCIYGPAVDIWSAGCVFAGLLLRKIFLNGDNEADQLNKIYSMFGVATETNWPGVSKLPRYQELMPEKEIKGAFEDEFRNYDPYAVKLLERMLTLDPSKRISAEDALEHDYFCIEPLPSKPKSPNNESSLQLMVLKRSREAAKEHITPPM